MAGHQRQSFAEALFAELRYAFQDARQKVLEEGWFGRVVSAKPVIEVNQVSPGEPGIHGTLRAREHLPTGPTPRSFEEQWAPRSPDEQDATRELPGHDFDR